MRSRQHPPNDAGRHSCTLRYIKPVFGAGLPEHIKYDDDTTACMPEAFSHVIGRAIEELMKVPAGMAVQS